MAEAVLQQVRGFVIIYTVKGTQPRTFEISIQSKEGEFLTLIYVVRKFPCRGTTLHTLIVCTL